MIIVKKIGFLLSLIFLLTPVPVLAEEEILLEPASETEFFDTVLDIEEDDDNPVEKIDDSSIYQRKSISKKDTFVQNALIDNEIKYDPEKNPAAHKFILYDMIVNTAKDVYNLEIERTDVPAALLKDQMTFYFEKGPLDNVHIWSALQTDFSQTLPERGSGTSMFKVGAINVLIDGQFKGEKENFRIMLDPTPRHSHLPFMEGFFQDLYVESHRLAHTSILVGNSRPGVGVEGAQSPYTLSFVNRAQIARNLANIRKFGARVRGDYSLMDYDIGMYSSSTNFTAFFPGHEFDAWMNIKPLGKTDGRFGKLVTGGGLSSGDKHDTNYFVSSAYAGYEFKKFWTKFEYAHANGSNGGAGLSNKQTEGMFVTFGYHLTKKLELLARYDQFDPDRTLSHNLQKEYTLGSNYYLKGQALKLILNYVYCQNDNKVDSHRLVVGTQILL